MKIVIENTNVIDIKDKEKVKKIIDREDFNDNLKTAIDNGEGVNVENAFGRWIYTILIDKD